MGYKEYQVERRQHDHREAHEASSVGPCNLLQEVHDERMDVQIKACKGDRVATSCNDSRDRVKIVGAVPVFDSTDQVIIVDHAYNKHIKAADREIVEQHHDNERNEHKHDKVLFGLFSGDHRERNITHDVMIDGKLSTFHENQREDTVKFLGITVGHSHHMDNDNGADNDCFRQKPRRVAPPYYGGKRW